METKRTFTYPISPVASIIAVGFAVELLHGVGADISRYHGNQGRRMVTRREVMIQRKSRYTTLCQLICLLHGQASVDSHTTLCPSFSSCEAKIKLGIKLPARMQLCPKKVKSGLELVEGSWVE